MPKRPQPSFDHWYAQIEQYLKKQGITIDPDQFSVTYFMTAHADDMDAKAVAAEIRREQQ